MKLKSHKPEPGCRARVRFPSPPLEERDRERRPSLSANTPYMLVQQRAGISPRTAASRVAEGIPSPALSSNGGEGEPLARCSRSPSAWTWTERCLQAVGAQGFRARWVGRRLDRKSVEQG